MKKKRTVITYWRKPASQKATITWWTHLRRVWANRLLTEIPSWWTRHKRNSNQSLWNGTYPKTLLLTECNLKCTSFFEKKIGGGRNVFYTSSFIAISFHISRVKKFSFNRKNQWLVTMILLFLILTNALKHFENINKMEQIFQEL